MNFSTNTLFHLEDLKQILNDLDKRFILGITTLGLSLFYLGKIWHSYGYFKRRGFNNPKSEFLFGNVRSVFKKKNLSEQFYEWTKTYGKTYGYFEGHLPVYVTSDLDFIQEIFIKQSSNFAARKKIHLNPRDNDPRVDLLIATKSRWKRMRMVMNPTFSSLKLRELDPILVSCADRLIDVLNKEGIECDVDIAQYMKRFTMDSIWNCAFGIDINIQYEKENEYFYKSEEIFRSFAHLNLFTYLADYFHEFRAIIVDFLILTQRVLSIFIDSNKLQAVFWLRYKVRELVELRKRNGPLANRKKDYIQLLLDANEQFQNEKTTDQNEIKKYLTQDEVHSGLMLFMLAGYETTSNTLTNASFVLVTHPKEQMKLYEEITSHFGSDLSLVNSESVQDLEYLDLFIKEVLRVYPIGTIVRRCTNPTQVKGISFGIDDSIAVDVLSIHYDEELWGPVDPNLFYPLRHKEKRHPIAFLAFGAGPRNCIGMKFAINELKIALAKLLINFEFLKSDKISYEKLEFEEGIVRTAVNGVTLNLKKRN
uniref:Cytochrome p450 CYP3045C15 n=1 Tax=Brachionus calyciflorus TaxID=104777 RepID=A0A2H4PSI1_9BILA|nr:cytochrome p450 CYP3045C15 [Brachionus calyciflorus]